MTSYEGTVSTSTKPNLASIVSQSFGLHHHITTIQGTMLQEAVYQIKTQLGISIGYYSHSNDSPA
jgi:hypothetical protein